MHHTICAMMIILYGMMFEPDIANEWLGMAIVTTLNDWFIAKPISFLKVQPCSPHELCVQAATVAFVLIEFSGLIVEAVERIFGWLKGFLADKCNLDLRWLDVRT